LYALPSAADLAGLAPTTLPQPAVADEETGRYLHHQYQARCLSIAPDGKRAVSGDAGGVIACFEPQTGKLLWSVRPHNGIVTRIQFIRDGAEVLSSSGDGTVKITNAADGSEKSTVWSGDATCIACADDSATAAAVVGQSDAIRVIDLVGGQVRWSVPSSGVAFDIAYSPDGKLIAQCRDRFAVFIREADSGKEVTRFLGHQLWVTGGCFVKGSDTIVTCSIDATARLWDVHTGTVIRELKHDNPVIGVAVSADGRLVATVGGDFLKLWDLRSGQLLHSFASSKDCIAVKFSPDGRTLYTTGPGTVLRAWRVP
jgi:WD40 repeat protein